MLKALDRPCLLYFTVAVIAASMRGVYAWLAIEGDFFPDLFLDSQHYASIARDIAAGRGAGAGAYVMSPLYPYFLSLFVNAEGELASWAVRSIQMGAGVIGCMLIASLARQLAGPVAGWLGGLTAAIYAPFIHYENAILVESLQAFCLLLAMWLLVQARRATRIFWQRSAWAAAGLLLGLAAGFRPVALLLLAATLLLCLWWQRQQLRDALFAASLLLAGAACAILPFTVRNMIVAHETVLLSAYGGMNFWIGNHAKATGLFNTPADYGFHLDPIGVELARQTTGQALSQQEASAWWMQRALDDIRDDPLVWLQLYGKKCLLFFHFREIPQLGNDFDWFARKAWPLQFPLTALPLLLFAVTLPIGLLLGKRAGMLIDERNMLLSWSWMIIYIGGISLFFITGRYRMPIMPLVLVLASAHLVLLGRQLVHSRYYVAALVLLLALLFSTAALHRFFSRSSWLPLSSLETGLVERQRGMALFDQKKYAEAETWYRLSLAIRENAMTRGNLANALKAQGRIDEAEAEYRKVIAITPRDHVVWYNLGNLYRDHRRDYNEAMVCYRKAISLNRQFAEPYLNLALLQSNQNDYQGANRTIEEGLANSSPSAHQIREKLVRLRAELLLRRQITF